MWNIKSNKKGTRLTIITNKSRAFISAYIKYEDKKTGIVDDVKLYVPFNSWRKT